MRNKVLITVATLMTLGAIVLEAYLLNSLPIVIGNYKFLFVADKQYITFLVLPVMIIAASWLTVIRRESRLFDLAVIILVLSGGFVMVRVAQLFAYMRGVTF